MKKFITILGFLFYAFSSGSQSQEANVRGDDADDAREFDLTISSGFSFFGPRNDMESAFISAGFDDTSPAGWGGGATAHPFTRKSLLFEIEATFYFNAQLGVSANGGMINNIEVLGYDGVGTGHYLFLDSKIKSFSAGVAYRTKNNRHGFFFGPMYLSHIVRDVSAGGVSPESNNKKPGAYLGYVYKPLMKKHWAVVLKAGYRWAPKSTIGPFRSEGWDAVSEFPATDVSVSCLNIGIGFMLRISPEERKASE